MCDIALGLQEYGLHDFAASVNAFHNGQWVECELYDEDEIDESWGRAFELALTRTLDKGGRFHFNLTGLKIPEALIGAPNPEEWVHCHACWELRQIVRNEKWFGNTLFYLDGELLTSEKVQALGIAILKTAV